MHTPVPAGSSRRRSSRHRAAAGRLPCAEWAGRSPVSPVGLVRAVRPVGLVEFVQQARQLDAHALFAMGESLADADAQPAVASLDLRGRNADPDTRLVAHEVLDDVVHGLPPRIVCAADLSWSLPHERYFLRSTGG